MHYTPPGWKTVACRPTDQTLDLPFTTDLAAVTCTNCLNIGQKLQKRANSNDEFWRIMERPVPMVAPVVALTGVVHYRPTPRYFTLCQAESRRRYTSPLPSTNDPRQVTCRECLFHFPRWRDGEGITMEDEASAGNEDVTPEADRVPTEPAPQVSALTGPVYSWSQPVKRVVHFKPFGWAATWCGYSPATHPALVCAAEPEPVDCAKCLHVMRRAGDTAALHADALREITTITQNIATKQDVAELKREVEKVLEKFIAEHATNKPRYMNVNEVAVYLSKTPNGIRRMVYMSRIPYSRLGGSIRFDREKIDRWVDQQKNRGKPF